VLKNRRLYVVPDLSPTIFVNLFKNSVLCSSIEKYPIVGIFLNIKRRNLATQIISYGRQIKGDKKLMNKHLIQN